MSLLPLWSFVAFCRMNYTFTFTIICVTWIVIYSWGIVTKKPMPFYYRTHLHTQPIVPSRAHGIKRAGRRGMRWGRRRCAHASCCSVSSGPRHYLDTCSDVPTEWPYGESFYWSVCQCASPSAQFFFLLFLQHITEHCVMKCVGKWRYGSHLCFNLQ